jgi:RNA polymerase sigma factor (sigma-70 family)
MRGPTDNELVSAARTGDQNAYGELFERYQSRVYNYAYSIVGSPEEARDIAQDAFIRVFEALPRVAGELNFSAYVYRTAHNAAVDSARARTRFAGPAALDLEREPALRADPERVALLKEQQERTWRAAFELPEKHREILTLRELHDMSYQEIADVLEMPRNTVGVLLSRARFKFKEAFRMSSINMDVDALAEECRGILPLLSARIDDELAPDQRASVEEHLDQCAFCRLALEEMTEASASFRGIMPLLPPVALHDHVHANIANLVSPENAYGAELSARRPWRWGHGVAVTVATLAAVGTLVAMLVWSSAIEDSRAPERLVPPTAAEQTATIPALEATATEALPMPEESPNENAADESAPTERLDTEPPPTPTLVSPAAGASVRRYVLLVWDSVEDPSGVSYVVQVQAWDAQSQSYVSDTTEEVVSTTLERSMTSNAERWRVRAVDGTGNKSDFSDWRQYGVRVSVTPQVTPETPLAPGS